MTAQQMAGFEIEPGRVIWRYMAIDRLQALIESNRLYFASAREFDDQFEGSITAADYKNRIRTLSAGAADLELFAAHAFKELTRLTKLNCWHQNDAESAAMWKIYLPAGKGVAIRSTVGVLTDALHEFRLKPEYGAETINVGMVKYIDYRNGEMPDQSMLGRFFYKRLSYSYENEVRVALSLRMAEEFGVDVPEHGVFVDVDTPDLVQEIRVAPRLDDTVLDAVRGIVKAAGLKVGVERSELDDPALF